MPRIAELEADVARLLEHLPPPDRLERGAVGRRARSLVSRRSGKYTRHRLPRGDATDLALDATLRAAAARTGRVDPDPRLPRVAVRPGDLRRKVRSHRSPFAIVFLVDNSYSIHVDQMVEQVKGLAFALLEHAAERGDRVALVAFKSGVPEATVALPLTRSRALARRRLAAVPLSGRTPLADGLRRSRLVLRQETTKRRNAVPVLVAITDGLPTVPLRPGGDPLEDVIAEARALRRAHVVTVIADTAAKAARARACAPALAEAAGGVHVPFAELAPATLERLLAQVEAARS